MKDFKNSTKVQYSRGGDVKGGAKGAAKVAKVTADFKKGLSAQPVKKSLGGILKAVSPVAALASGNPNSFMGGMSTLGLVGQLLKKKQSGQQLTPAEEKQVAAAPQAAAKGGAIKKKAGGMVEGTSARPRDAKGRAATMADLNRANRDTGGMTAAQVKAAGEAVARGNRAPRERIPTDAEAAQAMIARKKGGSVGFNSKPLVGKGGLSAMPRGKKC